MANPLEHRRAEPAREPGVVGVWNWALDALAKRFRVRAVPTPVRDLSVLLERSDGVGAGIAELQRVSDALARNEGFDSVPPEVLRTAAAQLDALPYVNRSKGLAMLRLQMRRQISYDLALEQASRNGQSMGWLPTHERALPVATEWTSAFVTTIPLDREEDAANDSKFAERGKPIDFDTEEGT